MTSDALILGLDGGGTGCRAVLADASGRVLGQGRGGPANIVSDPDTAFASVLAAAWSAMAAAGEGDDLSRLVAVLGLAGANVPDAATAFRARLPFASARVENDVTVATKGALGSDDGIVAAIGTGSIYGVQLDGRVRLAGGWGLILSDHGSGARMGRDLYEAALLAHDGFIPRTPLLAAVLREMGAPEAIVAFARRAAPADFARAAPRILDTPDDPAAARILADADAAIARALDHLQSGGPLPIVFTGGLGRVFAARLGTRYPTLLRPAKGSALDGALALARADLRTGSP
jgi:glucosamine kinase